MNGHEDASKRARKRNRPNAWRSCRSCKERKQRCELPDKSLLLQPSEAVLDEDHACMRCHVMGTECILDDHEKEQRIAMERRKRARMEGMSGIAADASRPTPSAASAIRPGQVSDVSPVSSNTIQSDSRRGSNPKVPSASPQDAAPSSARTDTSSLSFFQTRTHPEDLQEFKRYTSRSRPMTLVSELAVAQPNFGTAGPELHARIAYRDCDPDAIDEMVSEALAGHLSAWCEVHLQIWFPALPVPTSIRKARLRALPLSASVRLLEAAQYAVAIQHASTAAAQAMRRQRSFVRLVGVVETLISRCLMGSQRDIDAARALELLAAFPIASGYLDCGKTGKVHTLEVSILASTARRIASVARQENKTRKMFRQSTYPQLGQVPPSAAGLRADQIPELTAYEFELGVTWCSTASWDFCNCIGSDDVLQSYAVKHLPKTYMVESLLSHLRKNPTPGSAKEVGQMFVLLRAYRLARLSDSWLEMIALAPFVLTGTREHEGTAEEYTGKIGKIVKQFEEEGHDCQALRRSWLEAHPSPEAEVVLQWLDIEDSAWYILFFGLAIFYVMQHGKSSLEMFTPEFLFDMIKNGSPNDPIRQFVFSFGEDRLGVAESLLGLTNNLANAQVRTLDGIERDLIFPTLSTCGYVLESCMLSMEVHATTAKFWQTMPRRNQSWMYGMRGVVAMLRRMNDVSEEEGGIVTTTARIATGMLDVVGIWKRAMTRVRVATNASLQTPDTFDRSDKKEERDTNSGTTPRRNSEEPTTSEGEVAGIDVGIPPLATDGERVTLDHILRDMFGGSKEWASVLPSVEQQNRAAST